MTTPAPLDFRNKTIRKQCYFENETFANVNCQYAVFSNEVRFVNCTFNENIVFGDEFNNEAYCVIKSDLVFDNCVFNKQVKLEGLQCSGHVVFKNGCVFNYDGGDDKTEYALSLSNAKIGIAVRISDSVFFSGINLSALHIAQIGCQFFNIQLNNPNSRINFLSSYMGRELSINWSNIICHNIDFERTSVDPIHGSFQMNGKFYYRVSVLEILSKLLGVEINNNNSKKTALLYRPKNHFSQLVFVRYDKNEDYKNIISIIKDTLQNDSSHYYFMDVSYEPQRYAIFGNLIRIELDNNLIIYSLVADNKIYIKSVTSSTVNYSSFCVDDYAPFLFNNIFINENVRCDCFNVSYHVGTPIINAILSNGVKYTAALDDQFTFKTYKWNYIDCKALSNMISANVGSDLIVRGTELNLFSFDIQGLSAVGNIYFQDVIFHSCIFNASQIHSKNFIMRNIQFLYDNSKYENVWTSDNDEMKNWGIALNHANVTNKIEIDSLLCINQFQKDEFTINANYMEVGTILNLTDIACVSQNFTQKTRIDICNSNTFHLLCCDINLKSWLLGTENLRFEELIINNIRPGHKEIKTLWKDKVIVGKIVDDQYKKLLGKKYKKLIIKQSKFPIHFLKQIENIYEKYDSFNDHKHLWKLRNKMRIERDHPASAFFRKLLNCLLLNYGWSPWRIVIWLFILIIAFDVTTYQFFGMNASTSIVNGFVEFLPVSFNKPIIDQLRSGIEKDLTNIGYSALVTGYRMLSYFLLSILVAACAGYFRKKNQ